MVGWNLQAEIQAIERKIAEAKKKPQIAKPKLFKGQKREQMPENREVEEQEKPKKKKKIIQPKIKAFLKKDCLKIFSRAVKKILLNIPPSFSAKNRKRGDS